MTRRARPGGHAASDGQLEYRDIDPWNGYLAEQGGCEAMRVPFLPGTAPLVSCGWESDTLSAYEGMSYDSLGVLDTTRTRDPFEDEEKPAFEDTTWESNPDTLIENPR